MEIARPAYLNQLISGKWNGLIKIITGIRRCGKSYLLLLTLDGEQKKSEWILMKSANKSESEIIMSKATCMPRKY